MGSRIRRMEGSIRVSRSRNLLHHNINDFGWSRKYPHPCRGNAPGPGHLKHALHFRCGIMLSDAAHVTTKALSSQYSVAQSLCCCVLGSPHEMCCLDPAV